jgi:NodT family efflux transporter outer membrane factor (OMF) lipoprotein
VKAALPFCTSLAALALLSACAVGPDYVAPVPEPAATGGFVGADRAPTSPDQPPDDWWRLYDDERLDNLVREAFAANTDLRVAAANLEQAEGIALEADAGRYPTTQASAGASYGRDPVGNAIFAALGGKAPDEWTKTAGFSVSYEVDLFGRVRRTIEAAEAETEAVAALRDAVRVGVAAQVTRASAEICTSGNQLAIARQSLDLATRSRDLVVRQREAGTASELDLARAEGLVEQSRAGIPGLEGRRRAALYQLAALLARPPARAPVEVADCFTPPKLKSPVPVGDGAALLARRPDLRQAERRLAAATARIGVATSLLYPRITLGADVLDIQNAQLTGYSGLTFGLGPAVSWTIPNFAVARARIRQANAADAAALAAFDGSVLQALKETEQALSLYGAELDRNAALTGARSRADEALHLAEGRNRAGALSYFELLTVQQTEIAAAAAVAASDAQVASDQIDVFRALGGGWKTAAATEARNDAPAP